jgi:hypothetical protein
VLPALSVVAQQTHIQCEPAHRQPQLLRQS